MKSKTVKLIALLLMGVVMMSFLSGCFGPKYTVSSDDEFLTGLGEYSEGAKVKIVLEMWATDTDYTFYMNGEPLDRSKVDVRFDYEQGYVITFTMPDHDVYVTYEAKNSMVRG